MIINMLVAPTGIERVSGQFRSVPQSLTHSFFMPARMDFSLKLRYRIAACDVGVMFLPCLALKFQPRLRGERTTALRYANRLRACLLIV
jgi:hypothetical protein